MRSSVPSNKPEKGGGPTDLDAWADSLCEGRPHLDKHRILAAAVLLRDDFDGAYLSSGLELGELVADMQMDTTSVLAALFYRPARRGEIRDEGLEAAVGEAAAGLFAAVNGLADISLLDLTSSRMLASEAKDQTANIRRMLVALIDDVRVAVLKLAERVVALRLAKNSFEERKTRIATEAMTVFVPLADRLGIWRLKWELEDLSLRYLEPDAYSRIARQLAGRRTEREAQVKRIIERLRAMFDEQGVQAEVEGRAKHIYSIWRKMRAKSIPLDEVYDALAVRVIVPEQQHCYAALGLIHTRWRHVPKEFDDYVAAPKENGYRSIHTAVFGDAGEVFEVQIRTREMHDDAELGVCAHWTYKGADNEDDFYAEKVAWLRQVLDWQDAMGGTLAEQLHEEMQEQRIFVHTPKGHVVDLSAGATPLDFAYRVHTEIGHHCVSARVDGQRVPLNVALRTGQSVQIHRDPRAAPRRQWLDADLGYVHTARAKSKIRGWLRVRERQANIDEGRRALHELVRSLGLPAVTPGEMQMLADTFDLDGPEELFFALGVADLQVLQVLRRHLSDRSRARGLSVPQARPGDEPELRRHLLKIQAADREGLWRDITMVLSARGLSLLANSGRVDADTGTAWLTLELELPSLYEVARVINQLREVRDVRKVRRVHSGEGHP